MLVIVSCSKEGSMVQVLVLVRVCRTGAASFETLCPVWVDSVEDLRKAIRFPHHGLWPDLTPEVHLDVLQVLSPQMLKLEAQERYEEHVLECLVPNEQGT